MELTMVVTNSTSQTKKREREQKGESKEAKVRSNKSTRSKRGIKRQTKPKDSAKDNNKPHCHNALIATSANDTLDNIRVSLDMIREIVCSENDGMALSDDTNLKNIQKRFKVSIVRDNIFV
jgi:hypothetical protein